jgi:glycosyltransferase involved in cell wall biosynthesis
MTDRLSIQQALATKRILYVVHRYAPFPGGSENYVRDLAEETKRRGHDVWVFAGEHEGDLNGVHLTSDPKCIYENWDLIVVHGGDVQIQDYVLSHCHEITSPVLYLLILPSNSATCVRALHHAQWIGCSTPADWRHVENWNVKEKGRVIRHSINEETSVGTPGFRTTQNITTPYMFLSCGGYWPNKAFDELIDVFNQAQRDDVTLVLTGYDNRHGLMREDTKNVKSFMVHERWAVLSAIREADLYCLHSYSEGFGLVLLEAMWNYCPWAAREIAGAELMKEYGFTYTTNDELLEYFKKFQPIDKGTLKMGHDYVKTAHVVKHTVNDILRLLIQ